MATLQQITTRAKQLYKPKTGMKWTDAIKKASKELKTGKKVSGAKVVGRVKKRKAVKRVGAIKMPKKTVKRISVVSGVKPKSNVKRLGAIGAVDKGFAVISKINSLEKKLKTTKGVDARNFVKTAINKQHDKLDQIRKSL